MISPRARTSLNDGMVKALTLAVIILIYNTFVPSALAQRPPVEVIVEPATVTEFADRIEAIGTLRASESVQISANVTETVRRIGFDDGETVTEGQILVEFESGEEGARIAEARAALNLARQEYDRARRLLEREAISQSEYLSRQRDLAAAEAQLRSADAQVSDRVIRAPFDGVVGLRMISVGATVRPGDPIVRIDDVSMLNLDFPVPATRLTALAVDQQVRARASTLPDEVFEGQVSAIDSFIDPSTRAVMVRAVLPNPDGKLLPGKLMTVEVRSSPRQSVTINEGALIPFGRQMSVYVAEAEGDGFVAVQKPVTIGARRPGVVEITEGLEVGENVITHGTLKVRPGQAIAPTVVTGESATALEEFLSRQGG